MATDRVELVPLHPQNTIIDKLNEIIDASTTIRGAIAFWSAEHTIFNHNFIKSIGKPGFLCVDIHCPTNIDCLAEAKRAGGNIRLHLYRATGSTESKGTRRVPQYLLHSKTFVFDLQNDQAAIFIGSHNGTNRAMTGVNIETSVLIHTQQGSRIHREMVEHLEEIHCRCDEFQTDLVEYYKWLQGESDEKSIIELFDETDFTGVGCQFALYIKYPDDTKDIRRVGKSILVSITDHDGEEQFFIAKIGQSGELLGHPSLASGAKKYAFREGRSIPILRDCEHIPEEVVRSAAHLTVLTLEKSLPLSTRAVKPQKVRWEAHDEIQINSTPDDDFLCGKLSAVNRIARIERAVSVDRYRRLERNINERRKDTNRNLVTRVTIVNNDV